MGAFETVKQAYRLAPLRRWLAAALLAIASCSA